MAANLGPVIFSITSYVIETILDVIPGSKLITDDKAIDGELTVCIELPNNEIIFPAQKMMKRFKNGNEDSIYVYGYSITKEYTNQPFDEGYWNIISDNKKWWKFWS